MPPSILCTPEVQEVIQQEIGKPEKAIKNFWEAWGQPEKFQLSPTNIGRVRRYLKKCINQPVYDKVPGIRDLRESIKEISTLEEIANWHHDCMSQKRIDLL